MNKLVSAEPLFFFRSDGGNPFDFKEDSPMEGTFRPQITLSTAQFSPVKRSMLQPGRTSFHFCISIVLER